MPFSDGTLTISFNGEIKPLEIKNCLKVKSPILNTEPLLYFAINDEDGTYAEQLIVYEFTDNKHLIKTDGGYDSVIGFIPDLFYVLPSDFNIDSLFSFIKNDIDNYTFHLGNAKLIYKNKSYEWKG